MTDIQATIEHDVIQALVASYGPEYAGVNPAVHPAANPKFGDYQADLAMSLAKRLQRAPRDVAQTLAERLSTVAWAAEISVAGPGFINFRLRDATLLEAAQALLTDPALGVAAQQSPQRVVVDYSSPNVAKEMHVGHLRATIIGDCIARVLACQGHDVIRQNHVGDWGTQFGMLIQYLLEDSTQRGTHSVGELNSIYQAAKQHFDADPEFAERARQRVVALQGGDKETLAVWRKLVDQSQAYFNDVYGRLQVLLTTEDTRGESAYNDGLPGVVDDLAGLGLLKMSDGAAVVYPEGAKDRDGNPLAMIVRKSDGGYLYATTDLAAARYRLDTLHAQRIIYVTDARQRDHFAMVFSVLRESGWASAHIRLDHVPFGSVLGQDRKPFKTRTGGIVRLVELIDEAESRALSIIEAKNPDLPAEQKALAARIIGVGAMKYADLSSDRIKDYVFDWDKMLAFDGNTAPYLQNAYVRIQSIFRKAGPEHGQREPAALLLTASHERALMLSVLRYPRVVAQVGESLEPHHLCVYLFELATQFHHFYEHCPVLTAATDEMKASRLALCKLVAHVIRAGLGLLGIGVVEQM